MKTIFLLLAIATLGFISKDEVKPLLCDKKWTMNFLVISDSVVRIPDKIPDEQRPWIRFDANGGFENELKGKKTTGTWSYREKGRTITTTEDYDTPVTVEMNLIKLTQDSLVLRIDEGTTLGFKYIKP